MAKFTAKDLVLAIGSPGTNVVGQVGGLGEAGSSRDLIDGSAYGDDWKDWLVGQQDGDSISMQIWYDPSDSDHEALIATYAAGTEETFHYIHEDSGMHFSFPGLITACNRGGAKDGMLALNLTVKILSPGVEDVGS